MPFCFKEHCLFCGDICLSHDPKHPNRGREICQCKTADPAPGRKSTKEQILEKCKERGDNLADQVRIRVTGAAADLHAADGQAVRQRIYCQPGIKANDAVFSKLIALIKGAPTRIWSSVEIHQAMLDNLIEVDRANALTRKQLFFKVCQELGDQILVIRIEGCANMLGFRSHISEKLCLVKDPDEEIMQIKWADCKIWKGLVARPDVFPWLYRSTDERHRPRKPPLLGSAFKGVSNMLNGKAWPKAMRGLRMVVVALIKNAISEGTTSNEIEVYLNRVSTGSL